MPEPVDLAFAMRLRPAEAIEYFQSKDYVINWNWFDVAEEVQAKSFWVSKAMRQDILQDFREAMSEVLEEGVTERQFIRQLKPKLKAKGWWGKQIITDEFGDEREVQLGSPQRLRTIYRTNKFSAYQCGRLQRHRARSQSRPFWQYVAVMDSRTRPSHAALNGVVYRADDPIWEAIYPPNGFNCRCRVRTLSQRRLDAEGLQVSSSAGRAQTRDLQLVDKRTGEITFKPVTTVTAPDGQVFQTDPGFNSAPCQSEFDPGGGRDIGDRGGRNPVSGQITAASLGLPEVRQLPDSVVMSTPRVLDEIPGTIEGRTALLAQAVGLTSPVRWIEGPGVLDPVAINRQSLRHIVEKDPARARFANFIVPTLQRPFEVWDTEFEGGIVRRHYLALFADGGGRRPSLGAVRINRDGSLLYTFFPQKMRDVDKRRMGVLRWKGY